MDIDSRAAPRSACLTCAGVAWGFDARKRAAPPETWGAAIDVPLSTMANPAAMSVGSLDRETISSPGARLSTGLAKVENGDNLALIHI